MTAMANEAQPTKVLATQTPGSVLDEAHAGLSAGTRLGRYRIDAVLGQGGMGEVYRAEQLEPVHRTVALKLLRRHKLDARHRAYFEVERQLLAQMRHPAIAQVFDADTTPDGYPYFAMEYIEGHPITEYCDERRLSIPDRIRLFIRVCEGVQHAHQKGVVHRDLKPGNLLVGDIDGHALPKIIDFGIATAGARGDRVEMAGTPDYMSPEQAGDDQSLVDTRSDVYALGVVLCELLTGKRPWTSGETITGSARTLRLPSQQLETLSAEDAARILALRQEPRRHMRRMLHAELDWVVAKAMQHDRAERYASVSALAEDLQRFLDCRPVAAVPQARRYVWGKFVQRHRAGFVATSIVVLALVSGLALSVYGLLQARQQRAIAEQKSTQLGQVAAFQQSMLEGIQIEGMGAAMLSGLHAQLARHSPQKAAEFDALMADASAADVARGVIDHSILRGADAAIDRDFHDQPLLAADLRESVSKVWQALGLPKQAAEGFAHVAAARRKVLGAANAETLNAVDLEAAARLDAADPKAAFALITPALRQAATLPESAPVRIRLRMHQADTVAALGDRPRARTLYEAVRADAIRLHGEHDPLTMDVTNNLANLLGRMGEPKLGRKLLEALVPMRVKVLGPDAPETLASKHNLAVMRIMMGDDEAAVALQKELVKTQTRRLGAEHPETLAELGNLANMLNDTGQPEAALPVARAVVEARTRVLGAHHPMTLRATLNLATMLARTEHFDEAIALQKQVADARTRLLGPAHPDTLFIQLNRAPTLLQAGQPKAALAQLDAFLPLARKVLGDQHPQVQMGYDIRAQAAEQVGNKPLEIASFRELLALRDAALGRSDPRTVNAAWQLEGVLRAQGQVAAADELRVSYVTPLLQAKPETLDKRQLALQKNIRDTEAEEARAAHIR